MTRSGLLILLGVLVALTPFSGLPIAWRSSLELVFGFVVAFIGFLMRMARVEASRIAQSEPAAVAEAVAPEVPAAPHGVSPI